jgi:hypothetical protein
VFILLSSCVIFVVLKGRARGCISIQGRWERGKTCAPNANINQPTSNAGHIESRLADAAGLPMHGAAVSVARAGAAGGRAQGEARVMMRDDRTGAISGVGGLAAACVFGC